jgi:hypothetical protein
MFANLEDINQFRQGNASCGDLRQALAVLCHFYECLLGDLMIGFLLQYDLAS